MTETNVRNFALTCSKGEFYVNLVDELDQLTPWMGPYSSSDEACTAVSVRLGVTVRVAQLYAEV